MKTKLSKLQSNPTNEFIEIETITGMKISNLIFDNENREKLACPLVNSVVLNKYGFKYSDEVITLDDEITIYPPKYFDPIAPGYEKNLMCKHTYSIHHYSATWTKKGNVFKIS